jgi:CHAD domain-containing protein
MAAGGTGEPNVEIVRPESAREADPLPAKPAARPAPKWRKATAPAIGADATAEDALAEIIRNGLSHLRANEACVLARAHAEGVHQMRVAVRRLRSSLALYKDMLPADQVAYLGAELRWLIGELGPARDWDVFLADILPPVVAQFPEQARLAELQSAAEKIRDASYDRAEMAIRSPRYTGLVMLMGAWADGRRWHDPISDPSLPDMLQPAEAVATALLEARHHDVLSAGEDFEALDARRRHKLRIQIKKLRYATEFFASLFGKRRLTPYLTALKTLQDRLGAGNDVEVARRLVLGLAKEASGRERARLNFAGGLVVGWHGHIADNRERSLRQMWGRFLVRPTFWHRSEPAPAAEASDHPVSEPGGEISMAAAAADRFL